MCGRPRVLPLSVPWVAGGAWSRTPFRRAVPCRADAVAACRRRSRCTRPRTSQPNSRHQFAARQRQHQQQAQQRCPGSARPARAGSGRAARACGFVRRMISTAAQTMTKANSVPMFVRCSRASMGKKPASDADEDADEQSCSSTASGRCGWTSAKKPRRAPARRGPSPGRRAGR